jgi:hypothetical protein
MKKSKVIKSKNLPTRLPLWQTITTLLALDYWNAPQWLWGVLATVFLIVWGVGVAGLISEDSVDIFKDKQL